MRQKMYYHHSHFPGGLREETLSEKMEKQPTYALYHAVRGMLPVNKLRDARLDRLKIYADAEHAHEAQKPERITIRQTTKQAKGESNGNS
jgi:large subunit ribosomal protein L13